MGDFNINLLNVSQDSYVSSFLDSLGSHFILPQILLPTRMAENSKTVIDNILTTMCDGETFSGNVCSKLCGPWGYLVAPWLQHIAMSPVEGGADDVNWQRPHQEIPGRAAL